jgi:cobalamin-dependent methionine synthase I
MDRQEIAKLLTQASLVDNRRITEAHVEQWWRILNSCTFEEGERALVEHFKTSSDYLQPRHLFALVKREREAHAEAAHAKQLEAAYNSKPVSEYPGKPDNLDEMVDFYRKLAASGDWHHGEDADEAARRVGLNPPSARWS